MSDTVSQKLSRLYNSDNLPWIIVAIGIALRLIRYLYNLPLWFDEAVFTSDLMNRDLQDLLNPSPSYTQTGPLGYFFLVKLIVQAIGSSEYALRLLSLIWGVLSIFLFFKLSFYTVRPGGRVIALALFALLEPLVYQSANLKPYSGDVAMALLILTSAAYVQTQEMRARQVALIAAAGGVAMVFSNPAVFMLAGTGACLALTSLQRKDWLRLRSVVAVGLLWAICFGVIYIVYTRDLMANIGISTEVFLKIEHGYMPFPPQSASDIKWYIDTFFDTFQFMDAIMFSNRITLSGIMAFAFLAGTISMFKEKRDMFYLIMFPILVTLVAALLHQYPFKGRQILFLVPLFVLIIAEGTAEIMDKTRENAKVIGAVFAILVFIYPALWAAYHVISPPSRSEIRPVLHYIKKNWQPGDIIYVHFYVQFEMEYYLRHSPDPIRFEEEDYMVGLAPRGWYTKWRRDALPERYEGVVSQTKKELLEEYRKEVSQLKQRKRVWLLFSGDNSKENFFLSEMESIGRRTGSFGRSGAGITYLFDIE